jgi:hypothetical protein
MGSSLNKQPKIVDLELKPRRKSNIEYSDEFEECVLIWLDPTIRDNDLWSEEITAVRQIITHVRTFDNPNDCITYMKMVVADKIFLIVSQ